MAEEEGNGDLLASDARECSISRSLVRQRLMLFVLFLSVMALSTVASLTMWSIYQKLQAWDQNNFIGAFAEREAYFERLKSDTTNVMNNFKELTYSLEPRLDNSNEQQLMELLARQQKENRNFIKQTLKGAHKLAVQVRGAKTWYEQYSDKLDRLVNSSHLTQRTIKGLSKYHQPIYKLPATLNPRNLELAEL